MSQANVSKSEMGMWPGAYCVRLRLLSSEASLADIVLAAAVVAGQGGGAGGQEKGSCVMCCVCDVTGQWCEYFFSWYKLCNKY